MDEILIRALIAAARAFADELERDISPGPAQDGVLPRNLAAMLEVLQSICRINDEQGRGATEDEMRAMARRTGMDPRGIAGYYSAGLLERRDDGRWICPDGRQRLARLTAVRGVVLLDGDGHPRGTQSDERAPDRGSATGKEASRR